MTRTQRSPQNKADREDLREGTAVCLAGSKSASENLRSDDLGAPH
jgi:hypothetical protein